MAVVVGTAQGKLTLDASKFLSSIDQAYKALNKFNDLISETEKSLKNFPEKINLDLGTTGGGSGNSGGGLIPNVPNLPEDLPERTKEATRQVNILSNALGTGLTASLEGVGKLAEVTFSTFITYTKQIVGFAKDSLSTGLQFDATMSQVSAIAGATGEDLDLLRDKAIQMGAETKFSASEAGQAMVYMGMAGWKTTQIMDGLEGIMSLAAASGEDLATTSDIVTDALTAFGLGAENATEFANVLATASTNSNTNVALMGETFKYVAPLAGTMKYTIQDTALAIGLMANSGIKGSQAGTALRNVISNLEKPTDKVALAMKELGISLVDQEGNTKSLMELMSNLRKSFAGISNDKSMKEYMDRLGLLEDDLEKGVVSQEEYEEELNRLNATVLQSTDTLKGKYAAMISGKYGLSGLLAIVNASDEDFNSLARSIQYASLNMTGITEAVANSGVAWEDYATDSQSAEQVMNSAIDSMITSLQTLGTTGDEARDALASQFGLSTEDAQAALEALSTEFYKTGGASKEMENIMMDNLQGSITIFNSTMETFKIRVSDVLKGPSNEIVKFGQESIAKLTESLQQEGINGLIKTVGQLIPQGVSKLVQYIPEILPPLIEGFWALVNGFIDAMPEAAPVIIQGAISLFMGLVTGLNEAVKNLLPILPDIIDEICDGFDENSDEFLNTAIDLFLNLVTAVVEALPRIIKSAVGLVKTIAQTLIDKKEDILNAAIDLFLAIIEGFTDPETMETLITALFEIVQLIMDTLGGVDWLEVADKIFTGLGKGLLGIFEGAMGAIDELLGTNFSDWAKEVSGFFTYLKQQSFEFGKSLANAMNKTEIELNDLEEKYASTYQQMLEMYGNLYKQGMGAQEAMARAYQETFTSAEAQYVFKERFAGNLTNFEYGDSFTRMFGAGMTNQQIVDLLSKAQATSGNTYNFYTNEPIDERKAADEIRQVNESILQQ